MLMYLAGAFFGRLPDFQKPYWFHKQIGLSSPMTPKPTFMTHALAQAEAAMARDEVPVGAVLVFENKVIAEAGNRTRELGDPTAHAEMLVLREAFQTLRRERLTDCDLYVTLEPCTMCAGAISHARIRRLYYGAPDPKAGAVDNGVRFFHQKSCLHRPEVYGGIDEIACGQMLQDFFTHKR